MGPSEPSSHQDPLPGHTSLLNTRAHTQAGKMFSATKLNVSRKTEMEETAPCC